MSRERACLEGGIAQLDVTGPAAHPLGWLLQQMVDRKQQLRPRALVSARAHVARPDHGRVARGVARDPQPMHPSKELGGECPLLCGRAREHRAVVQLRRRAGAQKLDARQHLGRARRLPNFVGGEHGDMHRVRIGYDALGLHRVEEGERPPVFAAALASRDRGRVLHPAGHHMRVGAQLFPHRERLCVPS